MALPIGNQEDALLASNGFHLVVFNDKLLLQHLDCIQLLRLLGLCQHNLAKVAFTQHSKKIEVIQSNASSSTLSIGRRSAGLRNHLL